MKSNHTVEWVLTFGGIGFVALLFLIQILGVVAFFMGVYHAFSGSAILGVVSIFLGPVTSLIEIVDWFHAKEIWVELGHMIDSLMK